MSRVAASTACSHSPLAQTWRRSHAGLAREDDPPRAIDDRPRAYRRRMRRRLSFRRRSGPRSLGIRNVAWGHRLSKFRQFLRIGRPHDGSDGTIRKIAARCRSELFDYRRDPLIKRCSVRLVANVLKRPGAGITRSDQDVKSRPAFDRHADKRFERIAPEVGIDRQRVGSPGRGRRVVSRQVAARIGLGCRADVSTFRVADSDFSSCAQRFRQ